MKVYIIGGGTVYANWLPDSTVVSKMEDCDLVLGTGGEDWSPEYYGEPEGSYTCCNPARDKREWNEFQKAIKLGKPIVGICRSAQGLCIAAGGRLVQHQKDAVFLHPMQTFDKQTLMVTSSHHQAQYPHDMPQSDFKLLGWTEGISPFHLDGQDKEINSQPFKEAEVVWYPKIKGLGIQLHPEYREQAHFQETLSWLINLTEKLIKGEDLC